MPEDRPLSGIRVADFSWYGAGPIAARTLAAFGAEVIKVESEAHIDGLRRAQPTPVGKTGPNVSGYFNNFNAGKRSFSLNLDHPRARDVALRLIRRSDVMLENYTPRVAEKWGLTYADVSAVKPDIIYARLPMQGLTGPHRDFLGFGGIVGPVAGFSYLTGWPDRDPAGFAPYNYPDFVINPGHAATAILAALHYRNRTGKGQQIELAQMESTAAVLGPFLLEYTVNGRVPVRKANRSDIAAPHGIFRAAGNDRWLALAVFNDDQWAGLVAAMEQPTWATAEDFRTLLGRKLHEDELERRIEEWTLGRSAEEAMSMLQARGIPAGVVQTAEDLLEHDSHLQARDYYVYLDHPETGRSAYDGTPARLSATPATLDTPAPLLGQDNEFVLREVLEYGDDEIASLLVEQVVF
jgi:crotonobetainyl-CoA:carnitine CoA-transferase CaiB-like acyl-CoA transferase